MRKLGKVLYSAGINILGMGIFLFLLGFPAVIFNYYEPILVAILISLFGFGVTLAGFLLLDIFTE